MIEPQQMYSFICEIQLYALVKSRLIDFEGLVRSCLVLRVFPNSFDLYSA